MTEQAVTGEVRRAILSVFDKHGLVELARGLHGLGVEMVASGGTAKAIEEARMPVTPIEKFTGSPEVLDGRVKTLHPRVYGGVLADRRKPAHLDALKDLDWRPVDLVVCNLYPFQQSLAQGAGHDALVEKIDIGGPTLIRAAAKNADGGVTVVTDPADYGQVLEALQTGGVPSALRWQLVAKAFRIIADYDLAIAAWTASEAGAHSLDASADLPDRVDGFVRHQSLRYGENPHQAAALYVNSDEAGGVARGNQLAGKALSYNNYLDLDGAYRTAYGLEKFGCCIVKHTNPCGLAEAPTQVAAFEKALAGDPVSAFGSIIGFNTPLQGDTAEAIRASKLFVECLVAPSFAEDARETFKKRTNLRLVSVPAGDPTPPWHAHRIGGGLLVQRADPGLCDAQSWQCVTKKQPEEGWLSELVFAMRAVAALKSNAIAITKGRALLGAGTGQMSRVDAVEHAIKKAGEGVAGAFLGSDAFFPFDDCVRLAHKAGVKGVVQPGGSKRDQEVIAACDELGLVMMFTGRRHFRH